MNIAFVVVKNIEKGGGIEKYTLELGNRLVKRGHQVRVYSMKHYGPVTSPFKGMEIIPIPSLKLTIAQKFSAGFTAGFHASLSRWADIIHYHHIAAGYMAPFSRLMGHKCVIQFHGLEWMRSRWNHFGQSVLKTLEAWTCKTASHFTAVSKTQCKYYKNEYGINVHYIPCGADIKKRTAAREILKLGLLPHQYILFASRLVREKGAHYLIPAFRNLKTRMKLVIAGGQVGNDAYTQELQTLAGDDKRIIFPGFAQGRLLDELFSNAALFVQPSEIEGLSIALIEAMSYGLPCLVSNIPENLEALNKIGYTFQNKNTNDLHRQLNQLLKKPISKIESNKSIKCVKNEYNWDCITDNFENLYLEIIGKNKH